MFKPTTTNTSTSITTTTTTTTTPTTTNNNSNFPSINPTQLIQTINNQPEQNHLILDIRTPSAFKRHHLKQSINLNLPTTLLKRPLYGPDKIESGLPTPEERQRFERYKTALPNSTIESNKRLQLIIAIDQDARLVNPNHPLSLLLKKFNSLGFTGKLVWLNGGFQGLLSLAERSDWSKKLLNSQESTQSTTNIPDQDNGSSTTTPNELRMSLSIPLPLSASLPTPPVQTNHHQAPHTPTTRPTNDRPQPTSYSKTKRVHMSLSMLPPTSSPCPESPSSRNSTLGSGPRYPNLTNSSDSNQSKQLPPKPNSTSALNPFFDNIRQLNERLSLSSSLQNLSPIELPELTHPTRDLPRLPAFLRRLIQDSPIERARRLAHEFHDLEMAEQLRLEDVMRWESNRSLTSSSRPPSSSPAISTPHLSQTSHLTQPSQNKTIEGSIAANRHHHPFSISAGVELGYKNRYKNIWPYEHTRIRLRPGQGRRNETDYMNASMISFRSDGAPASIGSTHVGTRRYIATQGPLTSTFEDFWSVVGAEDVGLIIMITRRHEAGREKCADYLRNGQYGDLVVSVDHRHSRDGGSGGIESDGDEEREMASGFFGFSSGPVSGNHDDHIKEASLDPRPQPADRPAKAGVLRKTVRLSRTTRPDLPARQIAHIQYRGWPDFDVPPAAEEVLELIAESQRASQEIQRLNAQAIDEFISHSSNSEDDPEQIRQAIGLGKGPVIVHCSAGVGRTGSFILLDVMIDVLKALYLSNHHPHQNPTLQSNTPPPPPSHSPIRTPDPEHQSTSSSSFSEPRLDPTPTPAPALQRQHSHSSNLHLSLPRFLDSQLCDCRTVTAPIWQTYPIMAVVNEMREQRMSMVANYRQYVFLHEVLLTYLLKELNISTNDNNSNNPMITPNNGNNLTPTLTPLGKNMTSPTSTTSPTNTNTASPTNTTSGSSSSTTTTTANRDRSKMDGLMTDNHPLSSSQSQSIGQEDNQNNKKMNWTVDNHRSTAPSSVKDYNQRQLVVLDHQDQSSSHHHLSPSPSHLPLLNSISSSSSSSTTSASTTSASGSSASELMLPLDASTPPPTLTPTLPSMDSFF
ncbi:hypothetical protein PGT21_029792 [Puccinia graminis f. sp. tritici]|nr:hypothetical protein PGT21_029792 [Puccinia graminis f. sp. tritici]